MTEGTTSDAAEEDQVASGCFLCQPPSDLVYARTNDAFALCGLGPVVPYYTIVATRQHIPSLADDLLSGSSVLLPLVERVREMFLRAGLSSVVAEHGRVPICVETLMADRHCYHAHLLVFPGAPQQDVKLLESFGKTTSHVTAAESLRACAEGEYYLISDSPDSWAVCESPRQAPRQLMRNMVAASIGRPDLTSWRDNPGREDALSYAGELRNMWRSYCDERS